MKHRYISKTAYLGIVIGFFIGLARAIYSITASGYVEQGMFRLILLCLQDNMNKWVFFSFSGAILFSVIVAALMRLKPVSRFLVGVFGKSRIGILGKYTRDRYPGGLTRMDFNNFTGSFPVNNRPVIGNG